MKRLLLLLVLLSASLSHAQNVVRLTGTGKPDLDGEYRSAGTSGGRNRYAKEVGSTTYTIYCHREGKSSVWMIEDNQRNTYFGVNADTEEPPAEGWDQGREGTRLNASFQVEIQQATDGVPPARDAHTLLITLQNNQDAVRRVVVRAVSAGQEIIRARTYQPFETYAYQFAPGVKVYLLSEEESQQLMNSKGKEKPVLGRLLLTVRQEDAGQTFRIFDN